MSTTRRTFLAGAGATLAATGAVAAAGLPNTLPNPDAELLALGEEFETTRAIEQAAWKRNDEEQTEDSWNEAGGLQADVGDIVADIAELPARTREGMRIKARAIMWTDSVETLDEMGDREPDIFQNMVISLLRDVLDGGLA